MRHLGSMVVSMLAFLALGCGESSPNLDAGGDANLDAWTCAHDSDCDDGLYCDGVEHCVSGACVSSARPACDDGIACTIDACSEDQSRCLHHVPDVDHDGAGAMDCLDSHGVPLGNDCDDHDPNRFPGNTEICDAMHHDEDCDGATLGGRDDDGDTHVSSICCNGSTCGDDCDDTLASVHPGATEVCNALDDDCDMHVDEGVAVMGFVDADHDAYGDPMHPRMACGASVGFSVDGTDCDDTNPAIHPGMPEICDGLDNDCDPSTPIDAGASAVTWYRDADGDRFGVGSITTLSCAPPTGYSILGTDCDDANPARNPSSPELCNAIDDDCNGLADFVISSGPPLDTEDDDHDGFADAQCHATTTDCDDRDPQSGPGAPEICDGRDNDCDGTVDENVSALAFYRDRDGDGFGGASDVVVACVPPTGYARRGADCDDANASRFPGALEPCNDIDDDCDGAIDEGAYASAMCAAFHGTGFCALGRCVTSVCDPGWADCDPMQMGCESDTTTDAHCGGCTACSANTHCQNGTCMSCAQGSACVTSNVCAWGGVCDASGVCGTVIDCAPLRIDAYVATETVIAGSAGRAWTDDCETGEVPIGVQARIGDTASGSALFDVSIACSAITVTDTSIAYGAARYTTGELPTGSGAPASKALCPPQQVLVGIDGTTTSSAVTQLSIRCAPLTIGGDANAGFSIAVGASSGGDTIGMLVGAPLGARACPGGMIAHGYFGGGSAALGSIGLRCGAPTLVIGSTAPDPNGPGGGSMSYQDCPAGQLPISVTASTATGFYSGILTSTTIGCGTLTVSPASGGGWTTSIGSGATLPLVGAIGTVTGNYPPRTAACPPDQVIVGLSGSAGRGPATMSLTCAPVVVTRDATSGLVASFGTTSAGIGTVGDIPATPYGPFLCPPGTVSSGFRIHAGQIMDGIALRCAIPRLAP